MSQILTDASLDPDTSSVSSSDVTRHVTSLLQSHKHQTCHLFTAITQTTDMSPLYCNHTNIRHVTSLLQSHKHQTCHLFTAITQTTDMSPLYCNHTNIRHVTSLLESHKQHQTCHSITGITQSSPCMSLLYWNHTNIITSLLESHKHHQTCHFFTGITQTSPLLYWNHTNITRHVTSLLESLKHHHFFTAITQTSDMSPLYCNHTHITTSLLESHKHHHFFTGITQTSPDMSLLYCVSSQEAVTERMAAVVSLKEVIEGLAASQKLLTENMAQQQTTMNQLLKQEGELLQAITPVPMSREPNNGNDNYECYNCHTRITHHEGNDGGRQSS